MVTKALPRTNDGEAYGKRAPYLARPVLGSVAFPSHDAAMAERPIPFANTVEFYALLGCFYAAWSRAEIVVDCAIWKALGSFGAKSCSGSEHSPWDEHRRVLEGPIVPGVPAVQCQ
jgi:hypothetical protein